MVTASAIPIQADRKLVRKVSTFNAKIFEHELLDYRKSVLNLNRLSHSGQDTSIARMRMEQKKETVLTDLGFANADLLSNTRYSTAENIELTGYCLSRGSAPVAVVSALNGSAGSPVGIISFASTVIGFAIEGIGKLVKIANKKKQQKVEQAMDMLKR